MKKSRPRRINSAHVIAVIALVLAVTGTAVALPSKNTIDKNDIKKNAVNSADIKNGSVSSLDLKDGNATGADVKDGSLGGNDIDENTLGQVPNAATAGTAGTATKTSQIANIFARAAAGSPKQVILNNFGGLTLAGTCNVGPNDIEATTTVSNAVIDVVTAQDTDNNADSDFDVGEPFDADLGHGNGDVENYTLFYTQPNGTTVVVNMHDIDDENSPAFPGTAQQSDCLIAGIATLGSN